MELWSREIFNIKLDSLNQALSKKELSSLEFDGLLLRAIRVLDYVLDCFDEIDNLTGVDELKDTIINMRSNYEKNLDYPESIDVELFLYEVKKFVIPMVDVISEIFDKKESVHSIYQNPIVENFTDKERKRFFEIITMISDFCVNKLNESYFVLGSTITEELFEKNESGIEKGQVRIWAAGIVYAICKANGILGNSFGYIVSPGEIYDYFSVSSSSALLKSKLVIKLLDVVEGKKRWQGEALTFWDEIYNLGAFDSRDYDSNWTLSKLSPKEYDDYIIASGMLSEALMSDEPNEIVRAAKKCLKISKYLADAYYNLAIYEANTIESARTYLNDGIDMIESTWDDKVMKETIGDFWLDFDSRPYMLLLNAKLEILEEENKLVEAIELGKRMIILSSNDNLGVRYRLMNLLLKAGDFDGIDKLDEAFEHEYALGWNYSIALRYFKVNQLEKASSLLKKAFETNEHIAQYLIGSKIIHHPLPDHYNVGSNEEAMLYADVAKSVWLESKNAIKWLKAVKLGKPFIHVLN
ncbi:MAG: DUF6398 domain-containing protein [Acidaminobacteraceae bacterium]